MLLQPQPHPSLESPTGLGVQPRWGGAPHLLPVQADLESIGRLIGPELEAARVAQRVEVAVLHEEAAQVQGLWEARR